MKAPMIALVASLALVGGAVAAEQSGAAAKTPGHAMQDKGSVSGSPGASGYAPGQQMKSDTTGSTGDMRGPHGGSKDAVTDGTGAARNQR